MTILFHPNLRYLSLQKGFNTSLSIANALTVYSGVQPSAAAIAASWSSYNSTQPEFLLHYQNVGWSQPMNQIVSYSSITTFPSPATALNTGTGTWAIIWSPNPALATMGTSVLPSPYFWVIPVSDMAGAGCVRFDPNTNFVAATAYSIGDGVVGSTLS